MIMTSFLDDFPATVAAEIGKLYLIQCNVPLRPQESGLHNQIVQWGETLGSRDER